MARSYEVVENPSNAVRIVNGVLETASVLPAGAHPYVLEATETNAAGAAWKKRFNGVLTTTTAGAARTRPYVIAVFGDSFGQRAQNVLGKPGDRLTSVVSPVQFNWPTDDTSLVGGVTWGSAVWLELEARGAFSVPYRLNRAVGGSNSGQCVRNGGVVTGTNQDRLSVMVKLIQDERAAGRPVDAVVVHCGTNDLVSDLSADNTVTNLAIICRTLLELGGLKIVLHTVLPRGNDAFPSARVDETVMSSGAVQDRRITLNDINVKLRALVDTAEFRGHVGLADSYLKFLHPAPSRTGDVNPLLTYDGLHVNQDGARLLGGDLRAALLGLLTDTVASPLPAERTNAYLNDEGLFSEPGGALGVGGSPATNDGFTINGRKSGTIASNDIPKGWTVYVNSNFASGAPNNTTGTVTASAVPAAVGNALQLVVDCNSAARTEIKSGSIELRHTVVLPDTLAVGAYYEALARLDITGAEGFVAADIELRIPEPDGITRVVSASGAPPNGIANLIMQPADITNLIIRTPPRIRKAGTYGTITMVVVLWFAYGQPRLRGTYKISQASVRPTVFQ